MSLISWNYRGLNNPNIVPVLNDLVQAYHLEILFFCETLVHSNRIEDIKVKVGFDFSFSVDSNGRSWGGGGGGGGVWLFEKKTL